MTAAGLNTTVLLFRARDARGTSRIGYADSTDSLHFTIDSNPVLEPASPSEQGGGVEDPRVLRIGTTYYITYTGYNRHDAQLCLATSRDLGHWQRQGVILPAYKGAWATDGRSPGPSRQINGRTRHDSDEKDRDYMGLASCIRTLPNVIFLEGLTMGSTQEVEMT